MGTRKRDKRSGAERIADERKRQIDVEKYTGEHDGDVNSDGELAVAAACYAFPGRLYVQESYVTGVMFIDPWPWDVQHDKRPANGNVPAPERATRKQRIRLLEMAGALIAAEIDRLLRHQ